MTTNLIVRRLAAVAAVLGLAACADGPTAPGASHDTPRGLNFSLLGQASTRQGDTTTTAFTVDPTSATTFQVGSAHAIYFPAHSICDPTVSSYGPTEWDKPCVAMDRPLVITAKSWIDAQGLPQVDFSPSLRFAPGLSDGVQLALAVDRATIADPTADLHILWCANPTATCINEELADPTLSTWVSPFANAVYRRIKHFSGYNVSSGKELGITIDLGISLNRTGATTVPASSLNAARTKVESNSNPASDAGDEQLPTERTGHLMSSGRNN